MVSKIDMNNFCITMKYPVAPLRQGCKRFCLVGLLVSSIQLTVVENGTADGQGFNVILSILLYS